MLQERLRDSDRKAVVLKLADPLYRLQAVYYAVAGRSLAPGEQDQVLLESIARHLRRISPASLANDFENRLASCNADVVINEDLRDLDTDYPFLCNLGARFVRLTVAEPVRRARLAARKDLSTVLESETTLRLAEITPDLVIDNSSSDLGMLREVALPPILELLDQASRCTA
jgi:cytidine deaminase